MHEVRIHQFDLKFVKKWRELLSLGITNPRKAKKLKLQGSYGWMDGWMFINATSYYIG